MAVNNRTRVRCAADGYAALDASTDAASFGGADLDPAVAGYAFDVGSIGFANAWLALASFAVCAGWVVVATGIFGRWLGWWAIISGLGLALCRFFWTAEIWWVPYVLCWLWMIMVCIRLLCWSPATAYRGTASSTPAMSM